MESGLQKSVGYHPLLYPGKRMFSYRLFMKTGDNPLRMSPEIYLIRELFLS